jgi:hypothetical protein
MRKSMRRSNGSSSKRHSRRSPSPPFRPSSRLSRPSSPRCRLPGTATRKLSIRYRETRGLWVDKERIGCLPEMRSAE